jgi:hypothetical protein
MVTLKFRRSQINWDALINNRFYRDLPSKRRAHLSLMGQMEHLGETGVQII